MSTFGDFNRNLIEDMRANKGKPTSGPFVGRDVLILTSKGAKSGETRGTSAAHRDPTAKARVAMVNARIAKI